MADVPTFDDLFRVARDEILARNPHISREVVEREGTDVNALVAAGVAAADEVMAQLAVAIAGQFLDSAQGDALDRLVFDRYGLRRKPAAPALGQVEFTTTAAAPGAFSIPASTVLQTATGVQILTVASVTYPAGSVGPVTATVRSTLAGLSQQAGRDTITSIVSQIAGAPADLRVNNPLATAGADDEEEDESLRDRARRFFSTARRGTLAAIEAGALAVPGVRTAHVFETLDSSGRPARHAQVVVSDAFTESLVDVTPTPTTYQSQAATLATTVFNALDDVRGAGIFVRVLVAIVTLLPVRLSLSFVAGVDTDAVSDEARAVIVAYVNGRSPGQRAVVADMIAQLATVPGLIVTGAEVTTPVGDVVPTTLEVLRTSLALVTVA